MENNKNITGMSVAQLENGTPSDRVLILKSYFKGDRCTISPAKDMNGRYFGIKENIPEIEKLKMGYVPTIESRIRLTDDLRVDLNQDIWKKDWEWMRFCPEIAEDYATGQASPAAFFYVFRPGTESAKAVTTIAKEVQLMNYILEDSPENLYNRVSILGLDMSDSVITDVKEYLLGMAKTEPAKIRQVYESKTFSLELLLMHALERKVISKRGGVFTFGEILLGVEKKAVVAFFANPQNQSAVKAIEAVTYGNIERAKNPLEHESQSADDYPHEQYEENVNTVAPVADDGIKNTTLDEIDVLSPQQKAAATRKRNQERKK